MRDNKLRAINKLEFTLKERGKNHGTFAQYSAYCTALKNVLDTSKAHLSATQKEALSMIAHKIARILNGGATHNDNWLDIAGYAMLVYIEQTE